MEHFLIYRCVDGGYLFCPDFVQASVRAEHTYGPLELLGKVARAELDSMVANTIEQQVEDRLFAHLPSEKVEGLELDIKREPA